MEITTRQGQKTASIRIRTSMDALSRQLGDGYAEIMGLLDGLGLQPVGVPFAIYYNMDMRDLDVEMGFPVAAAFTPAGRVKPGSLPGGRTAVCVHKGPYERIADSYNALTAFITESRAVPGGPCCESYLNDPFTTKPEELLTEIALPLNE